MLDSADSAPSQNEKNRRRLRPVKKQSRGNEQTLVWRYREVSARTRRGTPAATSARISRMLSFEDRPSPSTFANEAERQERIN